MKRLLIAIAVAAPVLLAGALVTAQSEGAATRTAAAPSKLTICHKTGSASNQFRRITVSSRAMANPKSKSGKALRAHLRHTGDAVVAGAAACPSASVTPAPTSAPATKITICHKTGSDSNPYRRITISSRAVANPSSTSGKVLRGHMRHTGDLLMPGVTPCPSGTQTGQGVKLDANLQPVQGASGSGTASLTIRIGSCTALSHAHRERPDQCDRRAHPPRVDRRHRRSADDAYDRHVERLRDRREVAPAADRPEPRCLLRERSHTTFPNGQVQGTLST